VKWGNYTNDGKYGLERKKMEFYLKASIVCSRKLFEKRDRGKLGFLPFNDISRCSMILT
jgi:hypothetical protein